MHACQSTLLSRGSFWDHWSKRSSRTHDDQVRSETLVVDRLLFSCYPAPWDRRGPCQIMRSMSETSIVASVQKAWYPGTDQALLSSQRFYTRRSHINLKVVQSTNAEPSWITNIRAMDTWWGPQQSCFETRQRCEHVHHDGTWYVIWKNVVIRELRACISQFIGRTWDRHHKWSQSHSYVYYVWIRRIYKSLWRFRRAESGVYSISIVHKILSGDIHRFQQAPWPIVWHR